MTAVVCALAAAAAVALLGGRGPSRQRLSRLTGRDVERAVERDDGPPVVVRLVAVCLRRWQRRRIHAARETETVEVVFALAAELRAGRPPGRALTLVADAATHLRAPLLRAATAVGSGAAAAGELRTVADLPGCSGLQAVAAAWEVTDSAGGPVADVLDRLGEVLDGERQTRAALDAALAAPRATMLLLAALPAFGLVLGQSLGAHPLAVLLHRPLGWAMLATGAVLDAMGIAWTRLLVRRALR